LFLLFLLFVLFNVYTNDQPILLSTNSFICADDRCITAQKDSFTEAPEQTLSDALCHLQEYYTSNLLRLNPSKTQMTAFHLKNQQTNVKLNVTWNGIKLEHVDNLVYLGVTLDC